MTGAIACGNYSIAPPVAPVSLTDRSCFASSSTTAVASYTIANDGRVRDQASGILESWLMSGSASAYEVIATLTSGTLASGTTGSALVCSTSRTWAISNSARDNSTVTAVITVQIRDVATHTIQATATITLSAESDNFN